MFLRDQSRIAKPLNLPNGLMDNGKFIIEPHLGCIARLST